MSRSRITTALFSLAALALLVAGCGGGGSSSTSTASETSASGGGGMTVNAAEVSGLGAVLVDSKGFTVYQFGKDQGSTSSCYGACAENWPPVIAKGQPSGEGAIASQLGTTKRKDGSVQVTYAGHPLYTYAGDNEPGEANGNGLNFFGGEWWAMDESGEIVSGSSGGEAEPEESESSGGGYGY